MALWQFTIALLPLDWLDTGGEVHYLIDDDGLLDTSPAWWHYDDAPLEAALDRALSRGKSWSADLTFWGNVQTDDIRMFRGSGKDHAGKVAAVYVRFDLRQPNMALFNEVVRIASELRLAILVLETRSVVPLDVQRLLRAAAESAAAHFVLDPESFLSQAISANTRAS